MEDQTPNNLDDMLTEVVEFGVGAAILGLRRVNIERRKLVEEVPAAAPVVDAVLDQVESWAAPLSALIGASVSALGDAIDGEPGQRMNEAGRTLTVMGPELLRLSGLTKRD